MRPDLELIQAVAFYLEKPIDIYEAMVILNRWDSADPKPKPVDLIPWINEILTPPEDTDNDPICTATTDRQDGQTD